MSLRTFITKLRVAGSSSGQAMVSHAGGDSFASGLTCGLLTDADLVRSLNLGAAHGALAAWSTPRPGTLSMPQTFAVRCSSNSWVPPTGSIRSESAPRGVDHSGVARGRNPQPTIVTLGDTEPVSREPGPGAGIEERQSTEAIRQALARLPHSLQVPLLESMQGQPARMVADELGVSESTARRRIQEARDAVRDELARHVDEVAGGPYETVTDPVLERSQQLFEQTFAPSRGPEPGWVPSR